MPENFTNAVTALQATTSLDAEQLGYVDTALRGTSIVKYIPIIAPNKFMADEYYERTRSTTSVVQRRRLNQNPDAKVVNRYDKKIVRTALLGAVAEVDQRILLYKPNELDRRMNDAEADIGYVGEYDLFNGNADTSDGTQFWGLKALCTGSMLIHPGAPLDIGASTANFDSFNSLHRRAVRRIKHAPGQTIITVLNESVYEAIQAGRDKKNAAALGTKYSDLLNEEVEMMNGTPLLIVRTDDVGNDILPVTETASTSSMYIMAIGGQPGEGSEGIPNGIVGISDGNMIFTPEKRGNIRRVTMDLELAYRIPAASACRVDSLLGM